MNTDIEKTESSQNVSPSNGEGPAAKFFDRVLWVEKKFIAVCLSFMVILVLLQIFLRNFFNSGVIGGDSMVKHLVLWVGFLGAGLATRERSHIRIDVASRLFKQPFKTYIQIAVNLFSVVICLLLFYAAYEFVSIEYEYHSVLPFYGIPVWLMESIIPIGFLFISLRFIMQAIHDVQRIRKGDLR